MVGSTTTGGAHSDANKIAETVLRCLRGSGAHKAPKETPKYSVFLYINLVLQDNRKRKSPDFSGLLGQYWIVSEFQMVPEVGIEPTRSRPRGILSPVVPSRFYPQFLLIHIDIT